MFSPHTKFEVSTITCNENTKGNAVGINSCFEPPFGGLRGNAQVSSMIDVHTMMANTRASLASRE